MLTLKRQLLLVLLLTLAIPAGGIWFVLNLEQALRDQQAEQLQARASSLAETLAEQDSLPNHEPQPSGSPVLFAQPLDRPLFLDGYGDDWPEASDRGQPPMFRASDGVYWNAAQDDHHLYLLIHVRSDNVHYFEPQQPNQPHDRLVLHQQSDDERQSHYIRTSAPGPIRADPVRQANRADERIQGVWQQSPGGFTLELQLPRDDQRTHLGFELQGPAAEAHGIHGLMGVTPDGLPPLRTHHHRLSDELRAHRQPGLTLRLLDDQGWTLADARETTEDEPDDVWESGPVAIVQKIAFNSLRTLLAWRQPDTEPLQVRSQRLYSPVFDRAREGQQPQLALTSSTSAGAPSLAAVVPITNAEGAPLYVMLEQSTDAILSLSSTTLGQVLSRSLLLVMALALVLLGYAGWLSWRIARLRNAVASTVDEHGRVTGTFRPGRRFDEIGELAHHFDHLFERLHGYNHYLESFARKLSHELKTPLAIVGSSLDNLKHSPLAEDQRNWLTRADQGAERLRRILNAMSEASRLERSIERVERETFDLADVLAQTIRAYQDLDPDHRIEYEGPEDGVTMNGAPDLMVQLLDKLMDNARDFTPTGEWIRVSLASKSDRIRMRICNRGPQLPNDGSDLFSAFVSLREPGSDDSHLGQGLLIVRLIAEWHGGQVRAWNRSEGDGVCFEVSLPRTRAAKP